MINNGSLANPLLAALHEDPIEEGDDQWGAVGAQQPPSRLALPQQDDVVVIRCGRVGASTDNARLVADAAGRHTVWTMSPSMPVKSSGLRV